MNDYKSVRLDFEPIKPHDSEMPALETATDIMAAMLCDVGYESFEPDENGMTAYIRVDCFNESDITETLNSFPIEGFAITVSVETVEGRDWNSEWERNYFKPIVVADRCVIHSSFHGDIPKCEYDIVIDPKMAFGTGHHATTSLIIAQLLERNLSGKRVIDMGTGTGILAILSAMSGASDVTGIEIDPAAEINARENVGLNGHPEIKIILGDSSKLSGLQCDIFIANINRNVITGDIEKYSATLHAGGEMLLSGFYETDIPVVLEAAEKVGLKKAGHTVKGDGWCCQVLKKQG